MSLKWIDSFDIALDLLEMYPETDPQTIRFTDLKEWILILDSFDDEPQHCNERILEAVQACWMAEK